MARFARIVAPGLPHHITQRGNRRQPVFFCDDDYRLYIKLMAEWCTKYGVEVWAYCLMQNHIHLVAVPSDSDGLGKAVGEAHRRYSLRINSREGWTGHLWQDRFASFPMDERYLLGAVRYIELNPVRAKVVKAPAEYLWSSARAHITGETDSLVEPGKMAEFVPDWGAFLAEGLADKSEADFAKNSSTGRPLGDEAFCRKIAGIAGVPEKMLIKGKPGPKKKQKMTETNSEDTNSTDVIL